uniref:Uncharacterized protein n=1 Tax=Nelumbo nucifera TaxID=4432 RepID=A0A822YQP9_NELNU|nr:TPA_asm: hypothetical protein HUJ06_007155 [Nelumbo nucifera]
MDRRLSEAALRGNTPLHIASVLGHVDFVRVLLSNQPKLALRPDGSQGHTPLHLASAKGQVELLLGLIGIGDVDFVNSKDDDDGNAILHLAVNKDLCYGLKTVLFLFIKVTVVIICV